MTTELMLSFSIHTHLGRSSRAQAVALLARGWSMPDHSKPQKDGGTGKPRMYTGPGLLFESVHALPVPTLGTIYISSQTCLSTLALSGSVALEASACLPAEWSRCGPSSLPYHPTASEQRWLCVYKVTCKRLVCPTSSNFAHF